jgi:hypothetical protein
MVVLQTADCSPAVPLEGPSLEIVALTAEIDFLKARLTALEFKLVQEVHDREHAESKLALVRQALG